MSKKMFSYNFVTIKGKKESYKIAYIDLNPYQMEEVILCIHGINRNCRDFDYLADYLTRNNKYRIILVDIVGRGESDWLINKEDYTYETYINNIIQLLRTLDISKVSIIGTSMGGIIALMMAQRFPNLIKAIILNDLGPKISYKSLLHTANHIAIYPFFKEISNAKEFLRKYFAPTGINLEKDINHLLKYGFIFSEENCLYSLTYDLHIAKQLQQEVESRPNEDFDIWNIWNDISIPTLIIRGEKSTVLTREVVEKMLLKKEDVTFIEFPNVGHAPSLFAQEHITSINNWLIKAYKHY